MPSLLKISMLPVMLVLLLPECLITLRPSDEITMAVSVEMLNVFNLSPPVPQTSIDSSNPEIGSCLE